MCDLGLRGLLVASRLFRELNSQAAATTSVASMMMTVSQW